MQIAIGTLVRDIDPAYRGTWKVVAINGNAVTVTNPHTHSGRTYLPLDRLVEA